MDFETVTIPVTDRESWLQLRKQDVTASDVAAVFGLHPYRTPLQLWADKTSIGHDTPDNAAMRRGRWLEDAVIAAFKDHHPECTDVVKPGIYVRAPVYRLGCTPDAICDGGRTVIQCKTVAAGVFKSWDDGPPAHYQLQALTEALLLKADHAILAVLVTSAYGAEYREYDIPRHPAAEAKILAGVPEFWKQISDGQTPKADYGPDTELLARIHAPNDALPPLDLSTDNYAGAILEERERLMREKGEIEERLDAIKGELLEKLAGHTLATLPGWKITNRVQTRKETVLKATSFPVLRVSRLNEKEQAA